MDHIITTTEQLNALVEHYMKQDAFAFDVETVGDRRGVPAVNEVLWISLATHDRGDVCLLYTSPSPRDGLLSRMPSSA